MKLAHLHFPDITSFARVANFQQILTNRLLAYKRLSSPAAADTPHSSRSNPTSPPDPTFITFTPNPVYTTGRRDLPPSNTAPSSQQSSALSLPTALEPIRALLTAPPHGSPVAEYHPTLRGGQTTYHGPGQMVAYTILDLRRLGLTPRCHIRLLENSVIDVLRGYGVQGLVTEDPGVWVRPTPPLTGPGSGSGSKKSDGAGGGLPLPKKITAVGVHLRRNISSYGIGFNVTEEPMWYFQQIVPCGLEGREATSLEGLGVTGVPIRQVADQFVDAFVQRVNADFACGGSASGETIDGVYRVREEDLLREA
ncbi:lipoyl(octanoyl) transferase LIP2 [Aspergillus clavatus NRRL 1]|uniref:Octanoyltransferase n=1 Tax=Aspergillus clavatus (strain ATCC 1007 / CBS 513.65 / DSM 816 / NCTC 3887 / NRRL 1 / QM 1276 / 107) TaxID=344612 RepID=A1CJD7_ASPCL|nr:Lipoyltransferase, putative [Aspergillus clavatus NRRL 1]EAW09261.1 Lipoyltransferase, putative [Aspergillus clavatus NRRL 1]